MNSPVRSISLATLALAGLASAGCLLNRVPGYYEGGSRASDDQHVYVSRPHSPKTVTLVNTITGESIWSVDIPVGQQLVVRFYDNKYPDEPVNSTMMKWALMKESVEGPGLNNQMRVPGRDYRRLDMEVRDEPEMPAEASVGG